MSKITLGIIGGGQLGSMLATAAKKIDVKTIVFSDDVNAPAQNFSDEFITGKYEDTKKINEFINKVDLITYEFENIAYNILKKINEKKKVLPDPKINKIIQNRLSEKNFINDIKIKTTFYKSIRNKEDLKYCYDLIPGIIKTCTLGYDGKGQYKVDSKSDLNRLKLDFEKEYIFEKFVNLKKEISVIITRFGYKNYIIYEPIENVHEKQILKFSKIPANIKLEISNKSKDWATLIAEKLNFIGTLCVEYFLDNDENLYVNEIAPRVHNSGHLTINSHNISQFENHIRAVCNLQKIETKKIYNAKMINLIGEDIKIYRTKKFNDNEFFFDYLKKEIKKKRKMGHLTTIEN